MIQNYSLRFPILFLVFGFSFIACSPTPQVDRAIASLPDFEQHAGDWSGKIPCDGCEHILYDLSLKGDGTFSLEQEFVGGMSNRSIMQKGNWSFDGQNRIILKNEDDREVGIFLNERDGSIRKLSRSGLEIKGDDADQYLLTPKNPTNSDTGRDDKHELNGRWSLTMFENQSVQEMNYSAKIPHLLIQVESNRLSGSTGCNSMSGEIEVYDDRSISLRPGPTTRMMCEGVNEQAFLDLLSSVDSYKLEKDRLDLQSDGRVIAVFERSF